MNKNVLTIIVILIVVIGGFWYFSVNNKIQKTIVDEVGMMDEDSMMEKEDVMMENSDSMMTDTKDSVREFIVTGGGFSFTPSQIKVQRGDTVRIVFRNIGGTHDWNVDEFNASTNIIQAGEEVTVEFVADKTGVFEYYCSVGSHRQLGMVGVLTVEE